ncbi:MAG: PhnD/SsuA/transferrin family substrate-binding protein [Hydrogenophaga sp.]|uniref:PhnD/SsuA/transferrin family substrate-binding protein n=1 Tax=Hydrogenophaga sp. TaxID=1904254 RepID=UPI002771967A|nr:PhnD/SsuA/transferrin family substrate-binding protein [Hydrogenophaga sp.]MDP2416416.1 PhnD/SsuA/transferrin family substrate-binding protein [Hydrogenophaga sp.]MDZ4188504.1 PhnD/SsuA/transferrin family substrate-binding protein [Hydrogenophaga sp.]
MAKYFKCVLLGLAGMVFWGSVHGQTLAAALPLRFSAIALGDAEATVREFEPLTRSLSRLGSRPVEFVYLNRHEKVLDALREGRIELAVLGALPYAELVGPGPEQMPPSSVRLLARFKEANGEAAYRCVLVAFPDDQVVLSRAHGSMLAMPNRLSTCGPLSAGNMLRAAGVAWEHITPQYLGHQADVALAVVAGRAQLGALKESVALQHASLGLQVLASTLPLPGFVLVAHAQRVDAATLAKLARLPDTRAAEYQQWGANFGHGLVPASDADFAPVRAFIKTQQP